MVFMLLSPVGDTQVCVTDIDLLEIFYPFVTMANSQDLVTCNDHIGIHQAG
jgi:hypothetical protein